MAEKGSEAQSDKKAVEEHTAEVAAQTVKESAQVPDGAKADTTPDAEVPESPFGDYDDKSVAQLKSLAKSRKVEINRDVEKSELIRLLRAEGGVEHDAGEYPDNLKHSYDVMTLEDLRGVADKKGVELGEDFVRGHLVTELRAADTHS